VPIYYLELGIDEDFELIGISSHEKDYRLAWALNRTMNWGLSRIADIELTHKTQISNHAQYQFEHPVEGHLYTLIDNKTENGFLIPELTQFDYLIKIDQSSAEMDDDFYKSLRKTSFVLAVYPIDLSKLKSKQNLFYQQGTI